MNTVRGGIRLIKTDQVVLDLGRSKVCLKVPVNADVLAMDDAPAVVDSGRAIRDALNNPIGCEPLESLVKQKAASRPDATAVIVISDNTRSVPYKGESGILWPIVDTLLSNGISASNILILVATGTHRALTREELEDMLDFRIFEHGIRIANHDCQSSDLQYLCTTSRGSRIWINRDYLTADLKILTGLVESHFMAGASGGRKSVCPGLISRDSTYVFHGPAFLDSPNARDLVLEGNPVHEEALEVAEAAGVDFIVNVTLNGQMQLAGVFAGDLRKAHASAVEHLRSFVAIPVKKQYDLVVTHAGFVGINHYQAAKAAVVALPALSQRSPRLLMIADHSDLRPLGSAQYQTLLHLLKLIGPQGFRKLIFSEDWTFIPDQWQVQMWAKVFNRVRMEHLIYAADGLCASDFEYIPGINARNYLELRGRSDCTSTDLQRIAQATIDALIDELRSELNRAPEVAVLRDGPYGIVQAPSQVV